MYVLRASGIVQTVYSSQLLVDSPGTCRGVHVGLQRPYSTQCPNTWHTYCCALFSEGSFYSFMLSVVSTPVQCSLLYLTKLCQEDR